MDQKPQQLGAADRWLYHYNDFIPKIVRPSSNGGSIQALMAFLQERLPQQVSSVTRCKNRILDILIGAGCDVPKNTHDHDRHTITSSISIIS